MIQNDPSILKSSNEFMDYVDVKEKSSPYQLIYKQIYEYAKEKGIKTETMFDVEMALKTGQLSLSDKLFKLLEENIDDIVLKQIFINLLILDGKKKGKIAEIVVNEFKKYFSHSSFSDEEDGYLWYLGDALYRLSVKKFYCDYISIVNHKEFGRARQMVVLLLKKFPFDETISVLLKQLDDHDINGHILETLSKFDFKNRSVIAETFVSDERKWVAKIATRMLQGL